MVACRRCKAAEAASSGPVDDGGVGAFRVDDAAVHHRG